MNSPKIAQLNDNNRDFYSRESEYFLQKYGKSASRINKLPNYERMCNMTGYDKLKKREEFQSRVFTGLEDVQKVPTIHTPYSGCYHKASYLEKIPNLKVNFQPRPLKSENRSNKLIKVVLRLKKDHLKLERLQQMSDKISVKQLPNGHVEVEATIEEQNLQLFQQIFKTLALSVRVTHLSK